MIKDYFFFLLVLTASFKALPALNFGAVQAAILISL
jgi:hypothetical protein